MVLKNFYTIEKQQVTADKLSHSVAIHINKNHEIFKGHFPGNPVMPGVCMIQIIKDITEEKIGEKLFMEKCSNVKFMALINPNDNPDLLLQLDISEENGSIKVKNITKFQDTIALKLSLFFRKQ